MPRPLFTPRKDPVPIVQEAGWTPGPVWTGAENLAPTGIRTSNRQARSAVGILTALPGPKNHSGAVHTRILKVLHHDKADFAASAMLQAKVCTIQLFSS
jgi:hypothetical protein